LFTKGDPNAVDDYLAEDFVNHDPPFGASADREGMSAAGTMFRSVFPDWRSELHLLVGEGDIVVELFTASGTHRGAEIMGVAASGQIVTLTH
jgi:predicted ester cyclase